MYNVFSSLIVKIHSVKKYTLDIDVGKRYIHACHNSVIVVFM